MTRLGRLSPSFFVAVLALVVAAGGAGYAAGQITSKQIKDHTVASVDLARGSVDRNALKHACHKNEIGVDAVCVARASSTTSTSYQKAVQDCAKKGGRLPSLDELFVLSKKPGFQWADGAGNMYEFSSTVTTAFPLTLLAMDRSGNVLDVHMATGWHHCVTAA